MTFSHRLLAAAAFAVALTTVAVPVFAHPACSNVDNLEEWADNKSDAGKSALESRQFSIAFRSLKDAADALVECGQIIVDTHVKSGMDAGNTDENGLRQQWFQTNYSMAGFDYDSAAKAAAALHHVGDCHDMIAHERKAFNYTDMKGTDLSKDDRACAK